MKKDPGNRRAVPFDRHNSRRERRRESVRALLRKRSLRRKDWVGSVKDADQKPVLLTEAMKSALDSGFEGVDREPLLSSGAVHYPRALIRSLNQACRDTRYGLAIILPSLPTLFKQVGNSVQQCPIHLSTLHTVAFTLLPRWQKYKVKKGRSRHQISQHQPLRES